MPYWRLAVNKGLIFQQRQQRVNTLMMTLRVKRRKDGDRMGSDFRAAFHKLKLNRGDQLHALLRPALSSHMTYLQFNNNSIKLLTSKI